MISFVEKCSRYGPVVGTRHGDDHWRGCGGHAFCVNVVESYIRVFSTARMRHSILDRHALIAAPESRLLQIVKRRFAWELVPICVEIPGNNNCPEGFAKRLL